MQAAASIARSASAWYENRIASGALPVGMEMTARGDDAIEGPAIDDEIPDDGERRRAPRLELNRVAVLKRRMCNWQTVVVCGRRGPCR